MHNAPRRQNKNIQTSTTTYTALSNFNKMVEKMIAQRFDSGEKMKISFFSFSHAVGHSSCSAKRNRVGEHR
jgi:hypothetical protein